jgi:hypothetical protein
MRSTRERMFGHFSSKPWFSRIHVKFSLVAAELKAQHKF